MGNHVPLYMLSFVASAATTIALTPVAGRVAVRLGIIDRPSAHKFHRAVTPYLGGAAVAAGLLAPAAYLAGASAQLLTILLAGLAVAAVGLLDDRRPISPYAKLAAQAAAALALWAVGIRAEVFHVAILDLGLTMLWVLVVTNAFNLLDNMDGLTSGVAGISALTFFAIAASRGDYLVASFSFAVAGACLGFLRWNFPPARIFLGDTGSLFLGIVLAALALKLDLLGQGWTLRVTVPALAIAVPLLDTCFVVVTRLRDGRPVLQGGTDHSSHRLAARGLSPTGVAACFYSIQVGFAALALWATGVPSALVVAVIALLSVALFGVWLLFPRPVIVSTSGLDQAGFGSNR
jgi:UDP-GlcNAc:undecaprenyl-phosphate GlcNAc-1-phosphate transferase